MRKTRSRSTACRPAGARGERGGAAAVRRRRPADDRSRRARRQLARSCATERARPVRLRDQGRRLRDRNRGRRARAQCGGVPGLLRRADRRGPARPGRPARRCAHLRAQRPAGAGGPGGRLCRPWPCAGDWRREGTRALVGLRRQAGAAAAFGAASRYRDEPAGVRLTRGHARRDRTLWRRRRGFADEPFRRLGGTGRSDQRGANRAFCGRPRGLAGLAGVDLQLIRHLPWGGGSVRSRAPGLCAVWRQSDARRAQSDAAGRDAGDRDTADALDRGGGLVRL